jgi:hypothetical protein
MEPDKVRLGDAIEVHPPVRTRLFVFPGGLLEVADYGDGDESPGVYPELWFPALPQRVSGAAEISPSGDPDQPADIDVDVCRRLLRLLRDLP